MRNIVPADRFRRSLRSRSARVRLAERTPGSAPSNKRVNLPTRRLFRVQLVSCHERREDKRASCLRRNRRSVVHRRLDCGGCHSRQLSFASTSHQLAFHRRVRMDTSRYLHCHRPLDVGLRSRLTACAPGPRRLHRGRCIAVPRLQGRIAWVLVRVLGPVASALAKRIGGRVSITTATDPAVAQLRAELEQLHERVDFLERTLASRQPPAELPRVRTPV